MAVTLIMRVPELSPGRYDRMSPSSTWTRARRPG